MTPVARVCGFDCDRCLAAERCGRTPNLCRRGRDAAGCPDCAGDPLLGQRLAESLTRHLEGLDLRSMRRVAHPALAPLPRYLPILVQAYAEPIDVPWTAIHGRRLLGVRGRV